MISTQLTNTCKQDGRFQWKQRLCRCCNIAIWFYHVHDGNRNRVGFYFYSWYLNLFGEDIGLIHRLNNHRWLGWLTLDCNNPRLSSLGDRFLWNRSVEDSHLLLLN